MVKPIEKRGSAMNDVKKLIGFSDTANAAISEAAVKVGLSFSAFTRSAALKEASKIVTVQQPKAD
jgi:uncharacterized protein (DUF1778 family)